ncbi:YesL family protein [Sediminibacillus massiliensis]|uniref:YesL family protein n=1 Tax=Sediminibacillus massiliensis TaxID=1926277 RepID=UPI000988836A|nr:DUF624 domain-containing protein [Sediminibacillus massiliensis]
MNATSSFLYRSMEWITRFAYANLLWFLFTLMGGVLLGIFPATTALFALNREWLKGNGDLPVFRTFWTYYKKDFLKSNLLGLFLGAAILLIVIDFLFMHVNTNDLWKIAYLPLFGFMALFVLFFFYVFPAFVHFDLKVGQIMKNAFLIMLINPIHSFLMAVCLVSIFLIMRAIPALAFIFGASVYAFITMWISYHAFNRTRNKNKQA